MKREQLEHAIRTACQIISRPEVIVIGSQSILASYSDTQLPAQATMSQECDILPIGKTPEETRELADRIEGVAGEWSPFEQLHGFSIDGVDLDTAILPDDWRTRLLKVQNSNTAAPGGHPMYTGWCLEPHDLCAAKLCAGREKDLNFVAAVLRSSLIDADKLGARIRQLPSQHGLALERALQWLATVRPPM